jgi:hypothetical protein
MFRQESLINLDVEARPRKRDPFPSQRNWICSLTCFYKLFNFFPLLKFEMIIHLKAVRRSTSDNSW